MSFDPKDQNSAFDEIMKKIDELQQEVRAEEDSRRLIEKHNIGEETEAFSIDEDLFDQIKSQKTEGDEKEKSVLRRLIEGDEDENDEQDEPPIRSAIYDEDPEDIEDFETEEDRDEIYRDLKNTVGKMAVKMIFLFCLTLVSVYLFIAGFKPALFAWNVDTIWYDLAFLAVDLVCIGVSFGIFTQGLGHLVKLKADTDTMLALLAVSIVVVRILYIVAPDLLPYDLNFEPMLTIGLFFNVVGKKRIAANIKKNFKFISSSGDKLTVSVPASCETNNDLILETGEGGDVMYAHRTGLVSKYIEHSYSDFNWEQKYQRFFFAILVGVVVGTVAVSQLNGLGAAILFPCAAFSISLPFFSRYFYAASIGKIGKRIRKNGGILTSAQSAKELEDSDLLVISEEDFLGSEAVLLQGVKAMGDIQIDDLITNIAALFNEIGTPLKSLFLKMIDLNTVSLPRIDDVDYHEGLGYSCLIHSKVFLVGNKSLMDKFGVEFPKALTDLNLKDCRFPVYVAYQKQPAGIFIASFEKNKHTEAAIRLVEEEQVGIGIVSNNFLFTPDLLRSLYTIANPELFHFIPFRIGEACTSQLKRVSKAPDLIGSITGLRGLVACLYGSSKLLTALKINGIIRIIYPILAIVLMFFIALAGYSANTALQVLAFQFMWMLPVWLVCTFCK